MALVGSSFYRKLMPGSQIPEVAISMHWHEVKIKSYEKGYSIENEMSISRV